jgi:hypothetical protein
MGRVVRQALNVQNGFLVDIHRFTRDLPPGVMGGIFGGLLGKCFPQIIIG